MGVPYVPPPDPSKRAASTESIRVVVRIRPLSSKEKERGEEAATEVDADRGEVLVPGVPKPFAFDAALGADCSQEDMYLACADGVVAGCLDVRTICLHVL